MQSCDLAKKKCVPCEGGTVPLTSEQVEALLKKVSGWQLSKNRIQRELKFKDFKSAMRFVNQMAEIAEAEGHHPDFTVHYNQVFIEIWTHAISGLSENDFILAAKIDSIHPDG